MTAGDRLAVLKASYEDIRRENERLRDARASVTRQLGPLPISAAVVAGLVTGFAPGKNQIHHDWMLLLAGGLFGLMVVLSILYSNLKPYRQLRQDKEKEMGSSGEDSPSQIVDRAIDTSHQAASPPAEVDWYRAMNELEGKIRGEPRSGWMQRRLPTPITTLQEGFDKERSGLVIVQSVFAVVIVFLILARVVH